METMREFFHQSQPAIWSLFSVPAALACLWGGPTWLSIFGVSVMVVGSFFAAATGHLRGETEEIRRRL